MPSSERAPGPTAMISRATVGFSFSRIGNDDPA